MNGTRRGRLTALADALDAVLPGAIERDRRISELTTYRLGGPIRIVARIADEDALAHLATVVAEHRPPTLVIGRGSNLLVADDGYDGLGIVLTGRFEEIALDPIAGVVRAGGAAALPVVARRSAAGGLGGLEFLVGIPGSIGGAVRMNAGGHGREIRDVLLRARVVDLHSGSGVPLERDGDALDLGYRHSNLTHSELVVGAELRARAEPPDECGARIDEIVRWRREHQPGGANAGSVFRNPPGDAAGRLIDASGCKGLHIGDAEVSTKHANFFQAGTDATARDVYDLVRAVQVQVYDATGVQLVPELHMVGFSEEGLDG
ncbi:MAG TPA: UDP-N-acetylmuramate dehydrogenase [Acidimicrobiia bacterium]|nr:UDP-N-acetylmuramate dehydrogenase [Acidimicrobiia bacterium]